MTSGPVVLQVLEGEDAIARNREVMGATNPADAAEGTIRKDFAESIEANSVHGSDAPETAAVEIAFFFFGKRDRRLIRQDQPTKKGGTPVPPFLTIARLQKGDRHPDERQDDKNNDDFHAIHEAVIEAQMRLSLLVKTARIHVNGSPTCWNS